MTKVIQKNYNQFQKNWMKPSIYSNSILGGNKLHNLDVLASSIKEVGIPGHIVEAGVYKGGSAKLLATIFPDRRLLLFDSFEGMMEDDEHPEGKHVKGDFADCSLEVVQELLKDNKNCEFYKGWFPSTADFLTDEQFAFVHLDMDYYQSTRAGIEIFWPRVVSGGIMLIDDWYPPNYPEPINTRGAIVAVDEYFANRTDYIVVKTPYHPLSIVKK